MIVYVDYILLFIYFLSVSLVVIELARIKSVIKFFLIPILLLLPFGYAQLIEIKYGYPVNISRINYSKKYEIVSYIIIEPKIIYLWLQEEGVEKPRAYHMPYSKEQHKDLDKLAEEKNKSGRKFFGQFRKGNKKEQNFYGEQEDDKERFYILPEIRKDSKE